MTWNVDPDYIDVAERIRLFYERYPDGAIQTERPWVEVVDGRTFVCCVAHAYCGVDDERPSTGVAWEPVPGPTPFTKDSELMNAQTSAWGRAIVAAGIPSKKIATQQDVQARTTEAPAADGKVTKQQHAIIGQIIKDIAAVTERSVIEWAEDSRSWCKDNFGKESRALLTEDEADQLIKYLRGVKKLQAEPF